MNTPKIAPTVGIAIPCFQEEKYIEKCLRSCINQTYKGTIQLIVVDGGSTDGTLKIIKKIQEEFPDQIVLKQNPKKVTPISLNIGLSSLQTDFKMILGAHSYLTPEYIQNTIDVFESNETIDCVGGVIINEYEDEKSKTIGLAMSSPFGVGNATFRTGGNKGYVDTVAFGMYKKDIFEKIGYFNENLIRNQDDEFNFRLTAQNGKIWFDPNIVSHYYSRGNYQKLFSQYYQYGFWKVYVNVLHQSVTSIRQLIPCFFVVYLLGNIILNIAYPQFHLTWNFPLYLYLFIGTIAALKKDLTKFFPILMTFILLHISYGWGYLMGILQFVIFKQKAKPQHAKHNR